MHNRANLFVKLMVSGFAVVLSLGTMELMIRAFVPVRNVGPYFSSYDPIYGKVLKPNSSVIRTAPEFTMRFTTNSNGFRGPELGSLENGSILFLGDSFTMGYGVTDGEEYPALVRNHLDGLDAEARLEVINCGMGNNGNGRPLKFLRRGARHLNPKMIVVQIHETDFADNVTSTVGYMRTVSPGSGVPIALRSTCLPSRARRESCAPPARPSVRRRRQRFWPRTCWRRWPTRSGSWCIVLMIPDQTRGIAE